MRKLLLAALIGLSVAACQTPQQSAGTAGGVVAGAIVVALMALALELLLALLQRRLTSRGLKLAPA